MYMQRTTSGAAGNGLYTTIKCMRGVSGIDIGTTIKHLRRITSGAAGNGLGATMKYLRRTTSAAANNCLSTTIIPPSSAASFEVNSEPHTGTRPSFRLCFGPELARCVHLWRLPGLGSWGLGCQVRFFVHRPRLAFSHLAPIARPLCRNPQDFNESGGIRERSKQRH
jgi:hypothetical protein